MEKKMTLLELMELANELPTSANTAPIVIGDDQIDILGIKYEKGKVIIEIDDRIEIPERKELEYQLESRANYIEELQEEVSNLKYDLQKAQGKFEAIQKIL